MLDRRGGKRGLQGVEKTYGKRISRVRSGASGGSGKYEGGGGEFDALKGGGGGFAAAFCGDGDENPT